MIRWKEVQSANAAMAGRYVWVQLQDIAPGFKIRKWGLDMPVLKAPSAPDRHGRVTLVYEDRGDGSSNQTRRTVTARPDSDHLVLRSSIPEELLVDDEEQEAGVPA